MQLLQFGIVVSSYTFVKIRIFGYSQTLKNILIAPLDWGLGHTTRCVPLIRHIQSLGHRVICSAGNEWQRSFIRATFKDIRYDPAWKGIMLRILNGTNGGR